eukprot:1160628-Pelagomonas_calceolata.AAC.21
MRDAKMQVGEVLCPQVHYGGEKYVRYNKSCKVPPLHAAGGEAGHAVYLCHYPLCLSWLGTYHHGYNQ